MQLPYVLLLVSGTTLAHSQSTTTSMPIFPLFRSPFMTLEQYDRKFSLIDQMNAILEATPSAGYSSLMGDLSSWASEYYNTQTVFPTEALTTAPVFVDDSVIDAWRDTNIKGYEKILELLQEKTHMPKELQEEYMELAEEYLKLYRSVDKEADAQGTGIAETSTEETETGAAATSGEIESVPTKTSTEAPKATEQAETGEKEEEDSAAGRQSGASTLVLGLFAGVVASFSL